MNDVRSPDLNSHGRFEVDTRGGGQNRLPKVELKSES